MRDYERTPTDLLRNRLSYEPATGALHWRDSGNVAGHKSKRYIEVRVGGQIVLGHRIAWLLHYGEWPPPDADIDHINRDKHDNRISNLRLATRNQNNRNSARSDVGGVCYCKQTGRWKAYITVNYKQRWLGRYPTEALARAAREVAMRGVA